MNRKAIFMILVILGILLAFAGYNLPTANAIILIEGHITSDTTWLPADTYRAINDVYVDANVILTILPGVHVQFADGLSLFVEGSLNATGTAADPIVFTSGRVAANPPSPYPGAWKAIKFDGVEKEFFTIKYSVITYASTGITIATQSGKALIEKCEIGNNSECGIMIMGKSNVVIKENTIKQNKNGIATDAADTHSGIEISGNVVSSNTGDGIYFNSHGAPDGSGYIYNVTFSSNIVSSNNGNGIYFYSYGEYLGGSGYIYNVAFYSNTVSSNNGKGIYLYTDSYGNHGYIYDATFSSNSVLSNKGDGISLYSDIGYIHDATFSTNTVSSNTEDGIDLCCNAGNYGSGYIYNVTFSSNSVLSNTIYGVYLHCETGYDGDGYIYNATFSSNTVLSNAEGIYLRSFSYSGPFYTGSGYITNATFSSNTISSNDYGIDVDGNNKLSLAFDLTVSNNRVAANEQLGMYFSSVRTKITGNSVSYNRYGVIYEAASGNYASLNDIYSNTYGMNVTNGATVDAKYNYWGDASGPYNPSAWPEGKGNPVNGNGGDLIFIPFLTLPQGRINQRPVAKLSVDRNFVNINETVTFDAAASTDDGRIDYYVFNFGDGTGSSWTTLPTITHKYTEQGTYNATLIVMDDYGVASLDGKLVYVQVNVVPEFQSFLILPLLVVLTLLAVTISKNVRNKTAWNVFRKRCIQ